MGTDEEKLSWLAHFHAALEILLGKRKTLHHLQRGTLLYAMGWDWERAAISYARELKSKEQKQ